VDSALFLSPNRCVGQKDESPGKCFDRSAPRCSTPQPLWVFAILRYTVGRGRQNPVGTTSEKRLAPSSKTLGELPTVRFPSHLPANPSRGGPDLDEGLSEASGRESIRLVRRSPILTSHRMNPPASKWKSWTPKAVFDRCPNLRKQCQIMFRQGVASRKRMPDKSVM
jgi:hypothetical protein